MASRVPAAMKVGDTIDTVDGPANLTAVHWITRRDFGRPRTHARFLVKFPNGRRRFYNSDQVWPYNPPMSETTETPEPEQPDTDTTDDDGSEDSDE